MMLSLLYQLCGFFVSVVNDFQNIDDIQKQLLKGLDSFFNKGLTVLTASYLTLMVQTAGYVHARS